VLKPPSLTIGIEEEYQIIDPETRELRPVDAEAFDRDRMTLRGHVKPELHQSILEVDTDVCRTPEEARADLLQLRRSVIEQAARRGLAVASAGTHPFTQWMTQEITPLERYAATHREMRDMARQMLIFGTHVHIGIEDRDFLVDAMNVARYFIPHVLALTTSSPFWMGRNTGLKSYRSILFRNFPRTGIPPIFRSAGEFQYLMDTLTKTGCVADGTKIWWDIRPNAKYPTLEFRMCDACTRVDEAVCVAAILQALIHKLWKLRRDNLTFRVYATALLEENKWRACRDGLAGNLIDLGKQAEQPTAECVREFLEWFLADAVAELGTKQYVDYAYRILSEGTSADRQAAVFERTGSLHAVVDHLIAETAETVLADRAAA
jgi:glutamate---cysteine ligase / carboxylate-amine ligase